MNTQPRILAALAALLFAVSALPSRVHAAELVARRIDVRFETLDSGKAPASDVTVLIEDARGLVAAKYDFAHGMAFPGNSGSPEFMIPITHGPVTAADLHDFRVVVRMRAGAGQTDTWRFNCVLSVHMSNGGVITREAEHCGLRASSGGVASVSHEFQM